jgi:hypothetical protein
VAAPGAGRDEVLPSWRNGAPAQKEDQKTRTLSASSLILAASGGVVHCAFATFKLSSVAPRAIAHAFHT